MESKMKLLSSLLLMFSMCLPATIGIGEYGMAPIYRQYSPPPVYYERPVYLDTTETKVDYREANNTRHCGVQPTVRRHGLPKDETAYGEYPWVVAVLDTEQVYKCSGVLISPRHVLTAGNCVSGVNANDIVVRVGDYDLKTDRNYLEVYKNYEISVCKKHFYYSIPDGNDQPSRFGSSSQKSDSAYDAVILELSEDVDLDLYPQVEPICLPEFYQRSKPYYKEYNGYGRPVAGNDRVVNQEGSAEDLECWVVGYGEPVAGNDRVGNQEGSSEDLKCWVAGYSSSPTAEVKYQTEKTTYSAAPSYAPPPPPQYSGYGYAPPTYSPPPQTKYVPAYSYESYTEPSLTPRRAKVHKIYEEETYRPRPSYGYNRQPFGSQEPAKGLTENWEADFSYDSCRANIGSAIMCRIPGKVEEEDAGKSYLNYVPEYANTAPPQYPEPPRYNSPAYNTQPNPSYYGPPPPTPQQSYKLPPRYRRQSNQQQYYSQPKPSYNQYQQPSPPPSYNQYEQPSPPSYNQYEQPSTPSYNQYEQPPPPSYNQYEQPSPPSYNQYEQPTPPPSYNQYEQSPPPSDNQYEQPPPTDNQYQQTQPQSSYSQYQQQPPSYNQYQQPPQQSSYNQYQQPPQQSSYNQYQQPPQQSFYNPYQQPSPPPAPAPEPPTSSPVNAAEARNEESRRFAVFGIVQAPTACSDDDTYESKKLRVTPIKELLPWILNVIHAPASQCAVTEAPAYDVPTYQDSGYQQQQYSPPTPSALYDPYQPVVPIYDVAPYQQQYVPDQTYSSPPAPQQPVYSPDSPQIYSPPQPKYPSDALQIYSQPPPPSQYSPPQYSPPPPSKYSPPQYSPPPPSQYSPPQYSPRYAPPAPAPYRPAYY